MTNMDLSNLTKEYILKMFSMGKRFDGRDLLDFRNIELVYDNEYNKNIKIYRLRC